MEQQPAQIEVHRLPVHDEVQTHSFGYSERRVYLAGEIIQPLNAPLPVLVNALLP